MQRNIWMQLDHWKKETTQTLTVMQKLLFKFNNQFIHTNPNWQEERKNETKCYTKGDDTQIWLTLVHEISPKGLVFPRHRKKSETQEKITWPKKNEEECEEMKFFSSYRIIARAEQKPMQYNADIEKEQVRWSALSHNREYIGAILVKTRHKKLNQAQKYVFLR